jgi:hypothetical protein
VRRFFLAAPLAICSICGVHAAGSIVNEGTWTADQSGSGFVQSDFVYILSATVKLAAEENATAIVVGTVSPKGNFYYNGASAYGSIEACGEKFTSAPTVAIASIANVANNGCGS